MSAAILIVAVAALALAAWLRAAGSAISRVPRADALRDQADGVRGAGTVADLLEERDAITPAVAMVGSGLLVVAAVAGTAVVSAEQALGSAIAYAAIVFLVVFLLGDLAPGSWAGGDRARSPIGRRDCSLSPSGSAAGRQI